MPFDSNNEHHPSNIVKSRKGGNNLKSTKTQTNNKGSAVWKNNNVQLARDNARLRRKIRKLVNHIHESAVGYNSIDVTWRRCRETLSEIDVIARLAGNQIGKLVDSLTKLRVACHKGLTISPERVFVGSGEQIPRTRHSIPAQKSKSAPIGKVDLATISENSSYSSDEELEEKKVKTGAGAQSECRSVNSPDLSSSAKSLEDQIQLNFSPNVGAMDYSAVSLNKGCTERNSLTSSQKLHKRIQNDDPLEGASWQYENVTTPGRRKTHRLSSSLPTERMGKQGKKYEEKVSLTPTRHSLDQSKVQQSVNNRTQLDADEQISTAEMEFTVIPDEANVNTMPSPEVIENTPKISPAKKKRTKKFKNYSEEPDTSDDENYTPSNKKSSKNHRMKEKKKVNKRSTHSSSDTPSNSDGENTPKISPAKKKRTKKFKNYRYSEELETSDDENYTPSNKKFSKNRGKKGMEEFNKRTTRSSSRKSSNMETVTIRKKRRLYSSQENNNEQSKINESVGSLRRNSSQSSQSKIINSESKTTAAVSKEASVNADHVSSRQLRKAARKNGP